MAMLLQLLLMLLLLLLDCDGGAKGKGDSRRGGTWLLCCQLLQDALILRRRHGGGTCEGRVRRRARGVRRRLVQPRVAQDVGEGDALIGLHHQALPDEVLALGREPHSEAQLRPADLIVRLERDVAAHHVEQEDAQRPDRGLLPVVARVPDPLGRGVDSRACNNRKKRRL